MAGMVVGFVALGVGIVHCAASIVWTARWLGGGHLLIAQAGEMMAFWVVIVALLGGVVFCIAERFLWWWV